MTRGKKRQEKKQEKRQESQQSHKSKKSQKQAEKSQPISKPKKYVKKSLDALQRINKSKHQRIFLLKADRRAEQQLWRFTVLGTKGTQYTVTTSTSVHCTCIDYRMKKKPCKHIYFIVTQVAQNQEILDYFKSSSVKISKAAYRVLDQQLADRLKSRLQGNSKEKSQIDLKDDPDCTICFTEMDKQAQSLQDCTTCKKYFHVQCLNMWRNHNNSCPLCRSQFGNSGTLNDPLGRLSVINV